MPARTQKAAQKAVADPTSSASESEIGAVPSDHSGSDHGSQDGSENESRDSSGSEDESDSDSLDSAAPRKRRRVSAEPDEDDEEDEEDEEEEGVPKAPVTFISAPSRIKRNTASDTKPASQKPTTEQTASPSEMFGSSTTAPTDPNTAFESLGVHPWLVQSLANMAIRRPTGIQKGCIPEILKGRDCIGGSRTGSGKTVAFAVPILQKWAEDPSAIFALVLTPTR